MNINYDLFNITKEHTDVDMLFNIQNGGLNYFLEIIDKIDTHENTQEIEKYNNKVYLRNYVDSYFMEDIFIEKSIKYKQFINQLSINISPLKILEYLEDDVKIIFWEHVFETLSNNNFKNINLETLYDIFINDNIIKYIIKGKYWDYDYNTNINNNNNKCFIIYFIETISYNNEEQYIERTVSNLLFKLIKNKISRESTLNWVNNYTKICKINKSNNTFENIKLYDESVNYIKLLITKIIYDIWNNGINFNKLEQIVLSKNIEKSNFITKGFYLINDLVDISINSLYNDIEFYTKDLSYLNSVIKDENIEYIRKIAIESQIRIIKNVIEKIKIFITKYKYIIEDIYIYYQNVIYLLNYKLDADEIDICGDTYNEVIEDLLNNFNIIYRNNRSYFENNYDINMCKCGIKILNEKYNIKNPYLKAQFIQIISNTITNYSGLFNQYLNDNLEDILLILIKNYINFETCFKDIIHEKIINQSTIITILVDIFNINSNIKFVYPSFCENHVSMVNRFINIFLGNFMVICEELIKNIKLIKEYQENDTIITELMTHNVKIYNYELYNNLIFIQLLSSYIGKYLLNIGIKEKFCNSINNILDNLAGENKKNLKICNMDYYSFKPLTYLTHLFNIINNMKYFNEFSNYFITLKYDNIKHMNSILYKKTNINHVEHSNMDIYFNILVELNKKLLSNDEIEYPDEFYDPLMSTVIVNPVYLPNCDIVMDKEVIARHLLSDEYNPFNREKLTLQLLEEYNKSSEIKDKIEQFLKAKNKFIK